MRDRRQRRKLMQMLLTHKGKEYKVLYDDDDEWMVSMFHWNIHDNGYSLSVSTRIGPWKSKSSLYLHDLVMGPVPQGYMVWHKTGNRLINMKSRMEVIPAKEYFRRCAVERGTGVRYCDKRKKWCARARIWGKEYRFGYHATKKKAREAYEEGVGAITRVLSSNENLGGSEKTGNRVSAPGKYIEQVKIGRPGGKSQALAD